MSYVDGFVAAVPENKLDAYRELATLACQVWREHGALEYVECVADDVPEGVVTSFPMAVKREPGELVVFSYIRYESRQQRDEVMAKVMADARMQPMMSNPEAMPFDGQRMIWGGFKDLVRG